MCGIAGILGFGGRPVDAAAVRRMTDAMRVRGPDGEGQWRSEDGTLALGHRRLSIIDVDARADQPMVAVDGALVIVFNGEIYNYRQLREELSERGVRFHTQSDTEVLLELFRAEGSAMLARLRGMFAFAIWDTEARRLLLARDPYGIKPLYYANDGREFRFASQVKALVAGGIRGSPDPAGVVGFHLFGSVPEPFTYLDSVRALPGGHFIELSASGALREGKFADISDQFLTVSSQQTGLEAVRTSLMSSVENHLVADVPVGLFLSGGIDSGALLGLMRDAGAEHIRTVTLSFEEFSGKADDETALAAQVAQLFRADHHIRCVGKQEFLEEVPNILDAMDQPTVDGINTYFVSKAAHELGLKVVVSGIGGDELFGGYSHFRNVPRDVAMMRSLGLGRNLTSFANTRLPRKGRSGWFEPKIEALARYGRTFEGAYLARRCVFTPQELPAVMDPDFASAGLAKLEPLQHLSAQMPSSDMTDFERVAILESTMYLRNQLLRDADWAGMAHSLEIRVPLVDSVLLRQLAPHLRSRPTIDKLALALAPSRALPMSVTQRVKTGFATPLPQWITESDELASWYDCPGLRHKKTKWAKRWAHVVSKHFVGAI